MAYAPLPAKITFNGTAPLTVSMLNCDSVLIQTTCPDGAKRDNVLTRAEAMMLGDVLIRMAEFG